MTRKVKLQVQLVELITLYKSTYQLQQQYYAPINPRRDSSNSWDANGPKALEGDDFFFFIRFNAFSFNSDSLKATFT